MSKKTIVLADNSYTIRRIVELSFSEEEDIDLVSFENSTNLREKLLELRPAIVLVDIKLPEFNGYEVCRFVNSTESLRQTRVFLLKGGFEPVDESLLRGLRFVDIITKPFDSNALVSTIKNLLREMSTGASAVDAEEMPPSIPEDLAEVENLVESDEEISFSDVKDVIRPGDILSEVAAGPARGPMIYPDDEVLPSEEITQAQGEPPDTLAPSFSSAEDIDNPFQDEMHAAKKPTGGLYDEEFDIKRNIELEEQDLQIGSLTEEEMDIKKKIGAREMESFQQKIDDDGFKVSDEEMSAVDDMFSFSAGGPGGPGGKERKPAFQDIPDLKPAEIEREMGLDSDFEEPPSPPPAPGKIRMPHVDTQPEVDVDVDEELELYHPPSPFDETPELKILSPQDEMSYQPTVESMEFEEPGEIGVPEVEIPDYNTFGSDNDLDVETGPAVMEYEIPAPPPPPPPPPPPRVTRPVPPSPSTPPPMPQRPSTPPPPSRPAAFTPPAAPKESIRPTPPMAPRTPTPPPTPQPRPQAAPPKQAVRPTPPPPPPPPPPAPPTQPRPAEAAKPFIGTEIPSIKNEQLLTNVEDKLATAVKEMLWEIMPPLAEKIIKEEIEKIKLDVSKSFK